MMFRLHQTTPNGRIKHWLKKPASMSLVKQFDGGGDPNLYKTDWIDDREGNRLRNAMMATDLEPSVTDFLERKPNRETEAN